MGGRGGEPGGRVEQAAAGENFISVLVLTLNEEQNIGPCLASVSWADDILIVDSFSSDSTVEIARSMGARVVQRRFDTFADQRNFGIRHGRLRHPWVLHLDADERVTPELHEELLRATREEGKDAFRVPSKMMLYGRWLRRSGMYPTYQVRFGRPEALVFKQVGHGQREDLPPTRIGTLRNALVHHSFSKGLTDWFEKHNRYSSAEAQYALASLGRSLDLAGLVSFADSTRRRRALKDLSYRLPFRAFLRFAYMYILRGGILEGRTGLAYCTLLALYEQMIVLKIHEMRNGSANPSDRSQ